MAHYDVKTPIQYAACWLDDSARVLAIGDAGCANFLGWLPLKLFWTPTEYLSTYAPSVMSNGPDNWDNKHIKFHMAACLRRTCSIYRHTGDFRRAEVSNSLRRKITV